MQPVTENKIILITRRTRLDELISRFNTLAQAQFYVEHAGADFSDYVEENKNYKLAIAKTEQILRRLGRLQIVNRDFLPNFMFGYQDIVVVLGQDGLVANTVKYLNGQRVIGINPDPKRWEGILLPFLIEDLDTIVKDVFANRRPIREVTMAKAVLNDGQILYGVNDLFIGQKSHTSARYQIQLDDHAEQHSSSGIIVSTGLGSTGWLKSLVAGAVGIAKVVYQFQEHSKETTPKSGTYESSFAWDASYLQFTVREPFPSTISQANLIFGRITPQNPMILISQMPEHGVIFSDGIEQDFLEFNSGTQAIIQLAEKRGMLVV